MAFLLKRTEKAIRSKAKVLNLQRRPRMAWTKALDRVLKRRYPNEPAAAIAADLGCPVSSVHKRARALKLAKSEQFYASDLSRRIQRGKQDPRMVAAQFSKGHVPANKGLRRPGFAPGRMAATQFKKGQRSKNWLPVGSTRVNADGYLDRKIADTGYPPRDWRGEHILLWEEHLGPLPPKHCICFKNGDKRDIRIDNLACISRAERLRRNTIHRYPPELKDAIRNLARLKRVIRKRHEEQTPGSPKSSVCHDRRASRRDKPVGHRQGAGCR